MTTNLLFDCINGSFELLAGAAVFNHCRTLVHDKEVKGVSIWSTVFFSLWGIWNTIFYPSLGQWTSFIGGLAVLAANTTWVFLMLYYSLIRWPDGIQRYDYSEKAHEFRRVYPYQRCGLKPNPAYTTPPEAAGISVDNRWFPSNPRRPQ